MMKPTARTPFTLLALGMLGVIAVAFVLEYGFGVTPCKMCWWQRYGHFALAALALVGTMRPCRLTWLPIAATAGATLAVAGWQTAAQQGWLPFPPGCVGDAHAVMASATDLFAAIDTVKIVPCDKETFHLLGLTLANWNVFLMLGVIGWAQSGWIGKRSFFASSAQ